MGSRKRAREEVEVEEPSVASSLIDRLRNMWEFASLMQYIYIFGKAVRISEELDVEVLEAECLKQTPSEKLAELGLTLLKHVSSHRGLTLAISDEYTRRQYQAKAPHRNPFGDDEEPKRFSDLDVFTQIRVLHQLSVWTLHNPDRIRAMMPEQQPEQQTYWRIEPFGWDAGGRAYFVLDDDRFYRMTDPPRLIKPPKPKAKSNSKKTKATRPAKRRKLSEAERSSDVDDDIAANTEQAADGAGDEGLGGRKWEVVAITLEQYRDFAESIKRSKHERERELYNRLVGEVLPTIEKNAAERERKEARKLRELANVQKLTTAKRSSRIADKLEKQREIDEALEAERKRQADLVMARKEQGRQLKMEEARESRMMTREQRVKEREVKRILHEEELARLEQESKNVQNGDTRMSERQLKAEMERRQQELGKLGQNDGWVFDCSVCGKYGENLDDGTHSIACEKCNIWQHSRCHGIERAEAERDDFHFLCADCKRRIEDAVKPKLPALKFRLSSSPNEAKTSKHALPQATVPNGAPVPRPSSEGSLTNRKNVLDGPRLLPSGESWTSSVNNTAEYGRNVSLTSDSPSQGWSRNDQYATPAMSNRQLPPMHFPQVQNPYAHSGSPFPSKPFQTQFWNANPPPNSGPPRPLRQERDDMRQHVTMSLHGTPVLNGGGYPSTNTPATLSNHSNTPHYNPFAHPFGGRRPSSSYSGTGYGSPGKQLSSPPLPPISADLVPPAAAGFSPTKHSPPRPPSSASVTSTPVFPPAATFSPIAQQQIMSPPMKKMAPSGAESLQNGYYQVHHS